MEIPIDPQDQDSPLTSFLARLAAQIKDTQLPDGGVQGYVLKYGRLFRSQALTRDEQQFIDSLGWRRHRPNMCYQNAQTMALQAATTSRHRVLYAEGYVSPGINFPVPHAWLSLNGKAVDTTIRHPEAKDRRWRITGIIPPQWEYYGVEIDPRECLHSLQHDSPGPLIDDWLCRWPLLQTVPVGRTVSAGHQSR